VRADVQYAAPHAETSKVVEQRRLGLLRAQALRYATPVGDQP
jgi:hypothetical protein